MRISAPFGTLDELLGEPGPTTSSSSRTSVVGAASRVSETLGLRLGYPVELVLEAGPCSSVHYYIDSDELFFDRWKLIDGIPYHRSGTWVGSRIRVCGLAWSDGPGAVPARVRTVEVFRVDQLAVRNAVRREDVRWRPFRWTFKRGRPTEGAMGLR